MTVAKMSSAEEFQTISSFEALRKILISQQYAHHLEKPLAYWALPSDRRLPLAFLGRTLRDLLNTPFAELAATPGIGQKKMTSFVKLLGRAANTDPSELPLETVCLAPAPAAACSGNGSAESNGFDSAAVSEVVWNQWRASVMRHELGNETLGRFAPTLKHMTRVIWNTPLREYVDYSLADIRAMKTHGEKRVRAILEVFHSLHTLVANMGTMDHLTVRIVPRAVDQVERWVGEVLQSPGSPGRREIYEHFVEPLLRQIQLDAPEQIHRLAENRLGLIGPITSVRQAARNMGLTRARVYQLLNEINDIMIVRWPNGRHQVYELREKLLAETGPEDAPAVLNQFLAAVELFYPDTRRGAAGPLEQDGESEIDVDELVETGV